MTTTDLTALKDVKLKPQPVTIDGSQRPDGTAIAVTGYPLSSLLPISSRGYIGAVADSEVDLARCAAAPFTIPRARCWAW